MSLYNYVDPPNANLICCICRAPFTEPTTATTCAHTFCADCILRALAHSPSCPVDRTPLAAADLAPANPIVRSLVDELLVECVYRPDGCAHVAQRQTMPLHLRDECAYAEVRCAEAECGVSMRRMELAGHRADVHGEITEEEAKKEEVDSEAGEEEEESDACPHAAVGCPYKGPLAATEHLLACPYEALKGFFAINSAKMTLLTEQNLVLRHKVDTLESTVATLRKEMNAAKHALGPWFRASYSPGSAGASRGGADGAPVGAARAGAASSELPAAMQPAMAGPSGEGGGDVLAAYFPTEEMVRGGAMLHRTAGGLAAALDGETTLAGTVAGLRDSVVGLGAAVDSVGRRGEMALAKETLRMGEEMMSVRAQMHGLRMQVHGLLMERNAAQEAYLPGRTNMGFGSITKL